MKDRDIHKVVAILSQEIRQWKTPVVGVISNQTKDPFRTLISCLLSLRTKDETTAGACRRLFSIADHPVQLAKMSIPTIERAIYPVGFYRTKARTLKRVSRDLLERFNGQVPASLEQLLTLHGVGRKTANLVVTLSFKKPGICVDTHVHRISNRLGYVKTKQPNETEMVLRRKLPRQYWTRLNDLLVTYGQNRCTPLSPFCSKCMLFEICGRVGVKKSR